MGEQASVRIASDLRALLADPPSTAALPARRVTMRTIRLHVAAADAAQLVVLALAVRAFLPGEVAAFGAAETLGLGALAAGLAAAVRYALHMGHAPDAEHANLAALRAVAAVAVAVGATGVACWLALSQTGVPPNGLPAWLGAWFLSSAAVATALRYAAAHFAKVLVGGKCIVVVGASDQAEPLVRSIAEAPRARWRLSDRIDDCQASGLDRLVETIERRGADVVALAIGGPETAARTAAICERIADQPVRVCLALDTASLAHVPPALPRIGRFALVDLAADPHGGLDGALKRALDILVGAAALIALAPVLALITLAILVESPGPALFRQWRFGLGSRPIPVLKFRTMRNDSCDATGERRTIACDPRVTRIGRFLRRTSIDELPQLINVLRGEMSLVGPRPHPLHMRVDGEYYFEAVERYRARHLVKPGITGWAQVNGSRGEIDTLEKARRRLALDLWYLDNWSLALDLRILLRTLLGGFASPRAD